MILFRAARAVDPHFGRGSYWTVSRGFAERFRVWLDAHAPQQAPHVIYRAEVDLSDHLSIPFGKQVSSSKVSARIDDFAAAGYRWISFFDNAFEGTIVQEFVYLAADPIRASRVAVTAQGRPG